MNYTDEQIEMAFDSLPEEIQDMLFSSEIEQKISVSTGLPVDKVKVLNGITNFTIMGLIAEKDLETEIKNGLNLSSSQEKEITEKIMLEILKPIIDLKAKAITEQKEAEERNKEVEIESEEKETDVEPLPTTNYQLQTPQIPPRSGEKITDVAPGNLPIEETTSSFLPNLAPKTMRQALPEGESPFEEKMKKVFTGSTPQGANLSAVGSAQADPYREPIE